MTVKLPLDRNRIDGAIEYAYKHDYEIHECMNLLNSKGLHNEDEDSIRLAYKELDYIYA